jgi:Phosphatidyl serine synthase
MVVTVAKLQSARAPLWGKVRGPSALDRNVRTISCGAVSFAVLRSLGTGNMVAISLLLGPLCLCLSAQTDPPQVYMCALLVADLMYIILLALGTISTPASRVRVLQMFDAGHTGIPEHLDMRTEDCSFAWTNVLKSFDVYVIAHLVGFSVKAVMLQDRRVLWASALMFEAAEFLLGTFCSTVLPNLSECLWDRFLLDLALSNFAGMEFGLWFIGGERRRLSNFGPVIMLGAVVAYADVSAFLLKSALHLRTTSPLHIARLTGLASLAFPAVRVYERWCDGKADGSHMRALLATLLIEGMFSCVVFAKRFDSL